jgi:hypothetical protein
MSEDGKKLVEFCDRLMGRTDADKCLADLPMNKQQAITAMKSGEKVTHRDFTPREWIKDTGLKYEFEDECTCSYNEFWQLRKGKNWEDGWKIYS